jgi:hypothetical protein
MLFDIAISLTVVLMAVQNAERQFTLIVNGMWCTIVFARHVIVEFERTAHGMVGLTSAAVIFMGS